MVTLSVAQWRSRRLPAAGTALGAAQAERSELVGASPRDQRRRARAERAGVAAAASDRFMDVIVMLSVVVFLLLALGVGMLVLQSASQR